MTAFPERRAGRRNAATATCCCSSASNTPEANIHALRDIVKATAGPAGAALEAGRVPAGRAPARPAARQTARNLLGFKDGTANPNPPTPRLMDRIVWVQAGQRGAGLGGRRHLSGGAHHPQLRRALGPHAAAASRRRIIGREKATGAPLGAEATSPTCRTMPATPRASHAARRPYPPGQSAHAVRPQANLILRRPFNYSRGVTKAGQLDMGLLFICFQADLNAGFIAVQDAAQRRAAGGIHQADRRRLFLRPAGGARTTTAISARAAASVST